jgi:hypothetical protein
MMDIAGAKCVQVEISRDGKVLWVNTEDGCICRICRIENLEITDNR